MSLIPRNWNRYNTINKWALLTSFVGVLGFGVLIYDHLFPSAPIPSVSDLVLKDNNPTKLEISEIKIKTWLGDSEPYITVSVKNVSKRTAINVIPSFQGAKDPWYFTPTKASTAFQNGLLIEPQSTMEFPVAPVSEFLIKTAQDCAGCYLMGVDKDANIPISYTLKACQNKNPCELSSLSKPFGLNLHYKNIFNEPVHQFVVLFSYFSKNLPFDIPAQSLTHSSGTPNGAP